MQESTDSKPPGRRFGVAMLIAAWVAALAIVALLMQHWLDSRHNPNSQLRVTTSQGGDTQLALQRNTYGHYVAGGTINGQPATFMLDTGATDVVVTEALADELDLDYGYPVQVATANGRVTVHTTTLQRVTLGPTGSPVTLRNVRASINPYMEGMEVLLGMSFLKHFDLSQTRDKLTISRP